MHIRDLKEINLELKYLKRAKCLLACDVKLLEKQSTKEAKTLFLAVFTKTKSQLLKTKAAIGVSKCALRQISNEKELEKDQERWIKLQRQATDYQVLALRSRKDLITDSKQPLRAFFKWYLKKDYMDWINEV